MNKLICNPVNSAGKGALVLSYTGTSSDYASDGLIQQISPSIFEHMPHTLGTKCCKVVVIAAGGVEHVCK